MTPGRRLLSFSRQFHREFGVAGWRPQREATRSQATNVILPLLLDMGYDGVDVQLDTQESEWRPDLVRWWSAWLTSQEKWRTTYEDGKGGLEERYEGVLFIRADMVTKPLMRCALSRANRSLILFSFREWHFPDGGGNFYDQVGDPAVHRIADAITWIPRRLFSRISTVSCLVGNHEAVLCARNTMGIAPEETGYLLPGEQHDSDPCVPIYGFAADPSLNTLSLQAQGLESSLLSSDSGGGRRGQQQRGFGLDILLC